MSIKMIQDRYGKYIPDDGDAPLRALFEGKTETFTETFGGETGKPLKRIPRVTAQPNSTPDPCPPKVVELHCEISPNLLFDSLLDLPYPFAADAVSLPNLS